MDCEKTVCSCSNAQPFSNLRTRTTGAFRVILCCAVAVILPIFSAGEAAFGWAPILSHPRICQVAFSDPIMQPFLSEFNHSSVQDYSLEPSQESHSGQWYAVRDRKYLDTATPCSNGFDWNSLDETTRLQYLTHHAADCAVPIHHAPATYVYHGTQLLEGALEAHAATLGVSEYGSIAGTCVLRHTENKNRYELTGTITDVTAAFEAAVRNNASWYKSTQKSFLGQEYHFTADTGAAARNGFLMASMLQRATVIDYLLAKRDPVAVADWYLGEDVNTIVFDQSTAYDTDAISWNTNGTYSQIYGYHAQGIKKFKWDFNLDGNWDYESTNAIVALTMDELIGLGVPTGQMIDYRAGVLDNEGKTGTAIGQFYLVPEPLCLSLLSLTGLAILRRRRPGV